MDLSENTMLSVFSQTTAKQVMLAQCLAYMREHLDCWQDGSDEDLLAWLEWYWDMGLVCAMVDAKSGALGTLLVARFIERPEQFERTYVHIKGAQICVPELLIVTDPAALEVAVCALRDRLGCPVYLMHSRSKWTRDSRPKTVRWIAFERHLRRLYAQS